MGWDFVATNFIEEGDSVLCLSTGFFSDGFYNCLSTYGADTTRLTASIGSAVSLTEVAAELQRKHYKAVVATHVDTSTAVLTQLEPLSELIKTISPSTLLVVDAVASLVAEELRFSDWNLDIVLTGSQKALSCPPGLSILMVSPRAVEIAHARNKVKQVTWYASLPRWQPIMQAYEAKKPSYFATPPTQIVRAMQASLTSILSRGMEEVWRRHQLKSTLVKHAVEEMGLRQLPILPEAQANGLTAFWVPAGVEAKEVLAKVLKKGIMLSAGMHVEVGTKYVRFGHMGYSAFSDEDHVHRGIEALKEVMAEYQKVAREDEDGDGDSGYASPDSV